MLLFPIFVLPTSARKSLHPGSGSSHCDPTLTYDPLLCDPYRDPVFKQGLVSKDAAGYYLPPSPHRLSHSQHNAFARLQHNATVLAIGGSMTAGMGTSACVKHPHCPTTNAWPSLLCKHMRFPPPANLAQGGVTTASSLPGLGDLLRTPKTPPDLLLIDYGMNDAYDSGFYQLHSAVTNTTAPAQDLIFAATEAMLRYLAIEVPNTAVLVVESQCWSEATAIGRLKAAARYGVAIAIYPSILGRPCEQADWGGVNIHVTHPPDAGHDRIANALAGFLRETVQSCAANPPPAQGAMPSLGADPAIAERYAVCMRPLSRYDALAAWNGHETLIPVAAPRNSWILYEERRGKVGWVTNTSGSTLRFELNFGASPRLTVVYVRGYEGFGSAKMRVVGGNGKEVSLEGCCNAARVTQNEVKVIGVPRTCPSGRPCFLPDVGRMVELDAGPREKRALDVVMGRGGRLAVEGTDWYLRLINFVPATLSCFCFRLSTVELSV